MPKKLNTYRPLSLECSVPWGLPELITGMELGWSTLCLSSRTGTQPFNTAASITPHQENDVPLDPINKNNTPKLCSVSGAMSAFCACLVS